MLGVASVDYLLSSIESIVISAVSEIPDTIGK